MIDVTDDEADGIGRTPEDHEVFLKDMAILRDPDGLPEPSDDPLTETAALLY